MTNECEYVLCRLGKDAAIRGPDGVYEFCSYHARRVVEYSPNFDWPGDST